MPGGTYYRTYTNDGDGGTGEADLATVSAFRLDKYEVSVSRFNQFVQAWNGGAGWLPTAGSGKHTHLNGGNGLVDVSASSDAGTVYETGWDVSWNDTTYVNPTYANLSACSPYATVTSGINWDPIDCVTWWEAYAFCIWDGGFLPSEAEWEYAAAGGSQQREYLWGSTPPGTGYAIFNCDFYATGTCRGVTNIAPAGWAPLGAGLWGQLDLAGNLWQWNLDSYAKAYVDPCTDCAYLTPASLTPPSARVMRAGSFGSDAASLRPPSRASSFPSQRYEIGFRCARTP